MSGCAYGLDLSEDGRLEPSFVLVEAGTFTMGSPPDELGRDIDETLHQVTLTRPFYMQTAEVTQAQWHALLQTNPSGFTECGGDCPVEQVTWYEALVFANALSQFRGLAPCYEVSGCDAAPGSGMQCTSVSVMATDGNPLLCEGYRLPTEAEWEFAARAGTTTATYRGNLQFPVICDPQPNLEPLAWYCENASVSYAGASDCSGGRGPSSCGARVVASLVPNAWGLYDTLGNVWEWTWDWHGEYTSSAIDPLGADAGVYRVMRGGSWADEAHDARAACRGIAPPGERGDGIGFRLARTAP
ncbi:MAG: formylglycine-generating enzyme family protein [Phycisphaerales bacterium]|nr:formylglycine-generating enzyme family protein [Phycisphaerales bacterium]